MTAGCLSAYERVFLPTRVVTATERRRYNETLPPLVQSVRLFNCLSDELAFAIMTTHASQVRTYRILGCLAVLHSGVVLGLLFGRGHSFGIDPLSGLWLVLASSLFLWLLVLAIHPGRST